MIDVSIILVNYNTQSLTVDCINSIVNNTTNISYEIIVVDNDSTDGSKDTLSKDGRIKFVESGDNGGFGKGNNLGVSCSSGKYIFLLNTDTILINNAVKILYDYCESQSNENLGVIGSWLLKPNMSITTSCAKFPSVLSTWEHLLRYIRITNDYNTIKYNQKNKISVDVDIVSGANMFLRSDVFMSVQGFDEDYFMYTDEVDLQYRIYQKGYINKVIEGPKIIHLEGRSSGSNDSKKASFFVIYSMRRGRCLFFKKHKSILSRLLVFMLDLPIELILVFKDKRFKNKKLVYLELYKLLLPFTKVTPQIKEKSFYN